jgi:hypothetical protein
MASAASDERLNELVGKRVQVTTKHSAHEFTADLMAFEGPGGFVAFRTPHVHTNLKADYRLLRQEQIDSITVSQSPQQRYRCVPNAVSLMFSCSISSTYVY